MVGVIIEAEKILGVSKQTLDRWIRDGFITAEQITRERRGAFVSTKPSDDQPEAPEGWLALDGVAKALDATRQTVLHKVQRGELQAVHVNAHTVKACVSQVKPAQPELFATTAKKGNVNKPWISR